MYEGQSVIYVGLEAEGLRQGDQGQILATAGRSAAHVSWETGSCQGQVLISHTDDLAPRPKVTTASLGHTLDDSMADSLDVPGLSVHAVRQSYDEGGEAGLLNDLAAQGHLAALSGVADEALAYVATRIRQDPSFRGVLAHLDEVEGESLVRLASHCLVRDAAQGAEET